MFQVAAVFQQPLLVVWAQLAQMAGVVLALERLGWAMVLAVLFLQLDLCFRVVLVAQYSIQESPIKVMEASNNIVKNDPRNQPIVLATATIILSIGPTNDPARHLHSQMIIFGKDSDPSAMFPWDTKQALVELVLTNRTNQTPMIILKCVNAKVSDSMIIDGQSRFVMTLNFEINSLENEVRELEVRQIFPAGTAIPSIDAFSVRELDEGGLAAFFSKSTFPDGFEIKGGRCSVRLNSSIERYFDVPAPARGGLMTLIKTEM